LRALDHDLPLARSLYHLENNIVQTTGSAADSVSAGSLHDPAILLMGYDLDISRVTILAIAAG